MDVDGALAALARVVPSHPDLRLVLVYGSRARDDGHARSDWDVGYLGDGGVDHLGLIADTSTALGTDEVDVVDLARASALLRFEAARDGRIVHERSHGEHHAFVLEATLFWCDAEPVLRRAGATVLAGLTS